MKKVTKKEKLSNAMYVIKCPDCGAIIAGASEYRLLPSWSVCKECNRGGKNENI